MGRSFIAVAVLALPVDVESSLLLVLSLLLGGVFVGEEEHEHLLALHFFFGDAVGVVA
jgi:hypothetical protein